MTSRFGSMFMAWVRTCPGHFESETRDEVVRKAYKAFDTSIQAETNFEEFSVCLPIYGYTPRLLKGFGGSADRWSLAFPEGQK
jgi:hypothetical protein